MITFLYSKVDKDVSDTLNRMCGANRTGEVLWDALIKDRNRGSWRKTSNARYPHAECFIGFTNILVVMVEYENEQYCLMASLMHDNEDYETNVIDRLLWNTPQGQLSKWQFEPPSLLYTSKCSCGAGSNPAPCPFGSEINDDYRECNCCSTCRQQCADDI